MCCADLHYCYVVHCVPLLDRSGFVGTEVVKQLLEKGYTVRATVRSTSNKQKVAHLLALGDALPGKPFACPSTPHLHSTPCRRSQGPVFAETIAKQLAPYFPLLTSL